MSAPKLRSPKLCLGEWLDRTLRSDEGNINRIETLAKRRRRYIAIMMHLEHLPLYFRCHRWDSRRRKKKKKEEEECWEEAGVWRNRRQRKRKKKRIATKTALEGEKRPKKLRAVSDSEKVAYDSPL